MGVGERVGGWVGVGAGGGGAGACAARARARLRGVQVVLLRCAVVCVSVVRVCVGACVL